MLEHVYTSLEAVRSGIVKIRVSVFLCGIVMEALVVDAI